MLSIDESFVDAAAPNAAAIKNARALLLKGKLLDLKKDAEETIVFGQCKGSGKQPYAMSADFVKPDSPVYRCSCPSRQFPCKHTLALMYAYAQGKAFSVSEVPEDVASKRDKIEKREEKRKERADKPVQVDKKALEKKIKVQLEGLDLLEALLFDLTRLGLSNLNAKSAKRIEADAKKLRDAYLPGAQTALLELTRCFYSDGGYEQEELSANAREAVYSEALDRMGRLYALVRRGREALEKQRENPEMTQDTESSIAAWLGHAWKLRELADAGLVEPEAELMQLAFATHDDRARQEHVDTGVWVHLGSGRVVLTKTYRPYHAARFIKSDDSVFHIVQAKELCTYPGEMNPRVRWEAMVPRDTNKKDREKVCSLARTDLSALIKEVKNQLRTPLADKTPLAILKFDRIGQVQGTPVLEAGGERLVLADDQAWEEPRTCHLLPLLPAKLMKRGTLFGRFHYDFNTRKLQLKPLTFVDPDQVLRLTF